MQTKSSRNDYMAKSTRSEREILLDTESDEENDRRRSKNADSNLSKVKEDISSVTKTMKNNISKVLDRGNKIDELQDKSEVLDASAFQFISGSRKLQRKLWWQNMKLKLFFGFLVFGLIVVLICKYLLKVCLTSVIHSQEVKDMKHLLS